MRKIFKNTFIKVAAGIFVFAIVLTLGRAAFAQAIEGTALETQIGNLTSTLEKVFLQEKTSGGGGAIMASITPSGTYNPTCLDNYDSWNHSNTYLPNVPWNLDFIPREGHGNTRPSTDYIDEYFIDLNGDGLSDYIYKYSKQNAQSTTNDDQTCVYLNNGAGFELAYRCYAHVVYSPSLSENYYGDCADMSK